MLTQAERLHFHKEGYLGPYRLCAPSEMAAFVAHAETEVLPRPGPMASDAAQMRHLDSTAVYEMLMRPEIVERVAALYGPDVLIWRSNFFFKEAGGKEVPWHQDANYWTLDPPVNVTAWIALERVTVANSCVHLIPGSHQNIVPHIKADKSKAFAEMADPAHVPVEKALPMELEAGEFFLFNERLLHYSAPNESGRARKNIVLRLTAPFVMVPPLYDGHACLLVRGEDRFGLNRYAPPPRLAVGATA